MTMSADTGMLECTFCVPAEVQDQFCTFIANYDRDNQYSCGLCWLDDIVIGQTFKTQRIGHDSIFDTRKFLTELLKEFPSVSFEGSIEHNFLCSDGPNTSVLFQSDHGILKWDEKYRCECCRERFPDADLVGEGPFYCVACADRIEQER